MGIFPFDPLFDPLNWSNLMTEKIYSDLFTDVGIVTEFDEMEYLLIGLANNYGLDEDGNSLEAQTFEKRIAWSLRNIKDLPKLIATAKEKAVFARGVFEIEAMQKHLQSHKQNPNEPYMSNYILGLDSTASVLQMLSVLSQCEISAEVANLVNPEVRYDPYMLLCNVFSELLDPSELARVEPYLIRKFMKSCLMVFFYGGSSLLNKMTNRDKKLNEKFFQATSILAPKAMQLRTLILSCINPELTMYNWEMPDGFKVRTKVLTSELSSVVIDDIKTAKGNSASISHIFKYQGRDELYCALAANVVHSVDSLVVRELCRRLSYDKQAVVKTLHVLSKIKHKEITDITEFVSIVNISCLVTDNYQSYKHLTPNQLGILEEHLRFMLKHDPIVLTCIHDEFKTYPKYLGLVRLHYREIMAQLAQSNIINDMLRIITNTHKQSVKSDMYTGTMDIKYKMILANKIRGSRYALS